MRDRGRERVIAHGVDELSGGRGRAIVPRIGPAEAALDRQAWRRSVWGRPWLQVSIMIALVLLALIPRLLVQRSTTPMGLDMNDWLSWSQGLVAGDWHRFYARSGTDYLPGYLYVLWALGEAQGAFAHVPAGLRGWLPSTYLLYSLPAMLADVATVVVLYRAGLRWARPGAALAAAAVYALNPGVLYNSSVWGQVDSVPALFMLLATMWAVERRPVRCGIALALSILCKPTAVVLIPLLVLAFIGRRGRRDTARFGAALGTTIALLFVPFLPAGENPLSFMAHTFSVTAGRYPYLTIDAFNLWAAYLGGVRYLSDSYLVLGFSYHLWGWALLLALCAAACAPAARAIRRSEEEARYLLPTAALLMVGFFVLLTRMHERHLLPALPLLALSCAIWPRYWLPYIWLSAAYLLDLRFALNLLLPPFPRLLSDGAIVMISLGNVAMVGLIAVLLVYSRRGKPAPPAPLPAAARGHRESGG